LKGNPQEQPKKAKRKGLRFWPATVGNSKDGTRPKREAENLEWKGRGKNIKDRKKNCRKKKGFFPKVNGQLGGEKGIPAYWHNGATDIHRKGRQKEERFDHHKEDGKASERKRGSEGGALELKNTLSLKMKRISNKIDRRKGQPYRGDRIFIRGRGMPRG